MIELRQLQIHLHNLATIEETDSPVVSCYLNLESGLPPSRRAFDERISLLRKSLTGPARQDFEESITPIEAFVESELHPDARGAAFFSRNGTQPFFLPLQFGVPLPNRVVVNSVPHIYHLAEMKDTFHRYVVMISTEDRARILEVNLGTVTEQLWGERSELRKRVGREWTREHYQNHRRDRTDKFIKEKTDVLERLMKAGEHSHLILVGSPQMTSRVRKALPKHLSVRLVDAIDASPKGNLPDLIAATLSSFVEQEEVESLAMADKLKQEINTDGLAVAGSYSTLKALKHRQVDVLVMAKGYGPDTGWSCASCGAIEINNRKPPVCLECGDKKMDPFDVKEEMVRLAEQSGCGVEVVNHGDALLRFGGVGALLRYHPREFYE